jgi:hypothetical protein
MLMEYKETKEYQSISTPREAAIYKIMFEIHIQPLSFVLHF